jgi:hypothetical protein
MTLTVGKSIPKMWATIVISKQLLKVSHHPMGENSSNPVTLKAQPRKASEW